VILGCCLETPFSDEVIGQAHAVAASLLEAALEAFEGSSTARVPPAQGVLDRGALAHDHQRSGDEGGTPSPVEGPAAGHKLTLRRLLLPLRFMRVCMIEVCARALPAVLDPLHTTVS
jgi:hypothetical protein